MKVTARTGAAARVRAGQEIVVTNPHGTQVVDFWALRSGEPGVHLSMAHTRAVLGRLRPGVDDVLVDNQRLPILRFVEDSSSGVHDTLIAACDPERYRQLGVDGWHANCHDNFFQALDAVGEAHDVLPDPLNLFMNIPWDENGDLTFEPGASSPGASVTFLALADVVAVMSACPQDLVPINGETMTPRDVDYDVRDAGK
jgi:uncharacterized protein YcgI (DUF1989 family)